MDDKQNKFIKFALVCLLCVGLVTGLVYVVQFFAS
jgi:hypothetical protein